ncbi:flagellar hook-associated protein FlgL [Ornithinibacillus sp. 4-3]|uniref:Flagellar hook-associated protein FlgL n=1 Tax=Ornithinibacillus sp. 4-3 TaxID=3231488 RepID=A0AB39HVD6_9BACI
MRVTQGMLSNNMLRNLMNSQNKMDKYFTQLYTGKKISRPSDDPVVAMKGINHRTQVAEIEQYKRNIGETHTWMDNSDAALDKATQAMHRLNELAVQANNGTYDEEEFISIKEEVKQLKEHLVDIANTNVNGKYIFNGTNTNEKPISMTNGEIDSIEYNTNPILIEVSKGTSIPVNVDGSKVFGQDFFDKLDNFIESLDALGNDEVSDIDESIEDINEMMNGIVNTRAELGARMNRMELVENRVKEQEIIATKTMSDNENIDFEEAITNLITQESLHRAALSAGSRIIQPTLIDFLR